MQLVIPAKAGIHSKNSIRRRRFHVFQYWSIGFWALLIFSEVPFFQERICYMRKGLLTLAVIIISAAATTQADVLYFTNGDQLTGKLVNIVESKAVFSSDLAGEITIDLAKISTIDTDTPVKLQLTDGTSFDNKLTRSQQGTVMVSGTPKPVSFDQIDSINLPPPPGPKITGSVSTALSSSHGNTRSDSRSLGIALQREFERSRTIGNFDYFRSRQQSSGSSRKEVTEDWYKSRLKQDYLLNEKLYVYGEGRLESDKIAFLDRRTIIGGGLGYQWIENDKTKFRTEGGISQRQDRFTDGSDTVNETAAQMGYLFNHKINGKLKFLHELTYYPAISDPSDYLLTSSAELRATVMGNMFVNFRVLFDYDSLPANTAGSTDVKYIFGAGIDF